MTSLVNLLRAGLPSTRTAILIRGLSKQMDSTSSGPVAQSIQSKIETGAQPDHLEIINESYMHNVPKGSETHFKVVVVSKKFDGMSLIKVLFFITLKMYFIKILIFLETQVDLCTP